jgi:hypothetical protein
MAYHMNTIARKHKMTSTKTKSMAMGGSHIQRVQIVIKDIIIEQVTYFQCGPGNSFGTATGYGLDGSGIESRWRRDFTHLSRCESSFLNKYKRYKAPLHKNYVPRQED